MIITRRTTLKWGFAGLAVLATLPSRALFAQGMGDRYAAEGGDIVIQPVQHASYVLTAPDGMVIYNDPVGGAALYENLPRPNLILVTHEHGDHFDAETLSGLVSGDVKLITNPSVHDKLPDNLKAAATAIGNGDTTEAGAIGIEAIPAYNTTEDRLKYHPKGRDNGYVLTIGGKRVYIAGDTEDMPEMRALKDLAIAFVPMNLPFTMSPEQAADGVAAFAPEVAYPYHYKGSDPNEFASRLAEAGASSKVVMGAWYTS